MLGLLDESSQAASDPPDSTLSVIHCNPTGRPGRPRVEVDQRFLSFALEVRGSTDVADVLGCSPRTIRRRALEHQILEPGQSPFLYYIEPNDGSLVRIRHGTPRHTRLSDIADEELDNATETILKDFPHFGRRMIDGRLRAQGILVTRARIADSYRRVHGPPPAFGRRQIVRRRYWVAGVNSLWHHDGHHGAFPGSYVNCTHTSTNSPYWIQTRNPWFY
jgi:hypothetical protein